MMQGFIKIFSILLIVVLMTVFTNFTATATEQSGFAKIDPRIVDQFKMNPRQFVIVEMQQEIKNTDTSREYISTLKHSLVDFIKNKNNSIRVKSELKYLNMMVLEISQDSLALLDGSKLVKKVYYNGRDKMLLESSLPYLRQQQFSGVQYGGAGTSVAVIDTPIDYDNGYFGDCTVVGQEGCSVAVWENFTSEDINQVLANTYHGINVAGIVHGVAPEAKLLGLNAFSYSAQERRYVAQNYDLMEALDWVAGHAAEYNIVAVNMSLGSENGDPSPCNNDSRYSVFKTLLENHNVVPVVASGNENALALGSPACITNAFSVGASYDTDLQWVFSLYCADIDATSGQMVCFTNRTGNLDIMAPGANVTAGGIENLGGTSMAAPHVSGAIALLQSQKLADKGKVDKARNVTKELMLMSRPLIHDGYYFKQLNLDSNSSAAFNYLYSFAEYSKEEEDAAIPKVTALQESVSVLEVEADTTIGGLYLMLEVTHPTPEDIEVTLVSPANKEAKFNLQKGQYGFNGIIGREYLAGALDSLKGDSMNGEWKLSLTDGGTGADTGYLISATLVIAQADCVSKCEDHDCGDDGCGTNCGTCRNDEYCNIWNRCTFEDDVCQGDSVEGAIKIPFAAETVFNDNTLSCSMFYKSSCGGGISPERVYSFELEKTSDIAAYASGFDIIMYIMKDGYEGEEITCVKEGEIIEEENVFSIETTLDSGKYFLFVDGNDINDSAGNYQLTVKMCAPDCENKECGDDGCGGSCGECESGDCTSEGMCCAPSCLDAQCGDDGCGGSCGKCAENEVCNDDGYCETDCEPNCALSVPCEVDKLACSEDRVYKCVDNGEAWELSEECDTDQQCFDGKCVDENSDGDLDSEEGLSEQQGGSGSSGCFETGSCNIMLMLFLCVFWYCRRRFARK